MKGLVFGALRVVVRHANGSAADGARVALLGSIETGGSATSDELASGVTDADGSVALPQSTRGAVVCAWTDDASGVALLGAGILLPGEGKETARTCVVTLRPAPATAVEVVDPAGRAVVGASVFAWIGASGFNFHTGGFASSRAGTPAGSRPLASFAARTDAQELCRFPPLPVGEVDVTVDWMIDPPSADPEVLVEAVGYLSERRPLQGGAVRVELVPVVEVRALVTDRTGEPIPRCEWSIAPGNWGFGSTPTDSWLARSRSR